MSLQQLFPQQHSEITSKLAEKFPTSTYSVGVLMDEAFVLKLAQPDEILNKHTSFIVLKGFEGASDEVHFLTVKGTNYDLVKFLGIAASSAPSINLLVADTFTTAEAESVPLNTIASSPQSVLGDAYARHLSTQGFASGTTMKTVVKAVGAATSGGSSELATKVANLPFDVGVYDLGTHTYSESRVDTYNLALVRFMPDPTSRDLLTLAQYPYTTTGHEVKVRGFLVNTAKLGAPATDAALDLKSLADQWTGKTGVLQLLSRTPSSPLANIGESNFLSGMGELQASRTQANAIFVVTGLEWVPPGSSHMAKELPGLTFPQNSLVRHIEVKGWILPPEQTAWTASAGLLPGVMFDFAAEGIEPRIYATFTAMAPSPAPVPVPVKIDGILVSDRAMRAALETGLSDARGKDPWSEAIIAAASNASYNRFFTATGGYLWPLKVEPWNPLDGQPTPMILYQAEGRLKWTPTIGEGFTRYEVRNSNSPMTSPGAGTVVATITDKAARTYTLPDDAKGYYTVWAFNSKGSAASNSLYVEGAPVVVLSSVVFCASNQKTCLKVGWSQYSGSGFQKYEIYRRTGGGSWALVQTITSVGTTTHDDSGLTCGTTYDYRVSLYVNGKRGDSNSLSGNPNNGFGGCTASAVAVTSVVLCDTSPKTCLRVGWSQYTGGGFEKYEVYRRASGGDWSLAQTITAAGTTSHSDSSLTCGTTYEYKVRLYSAGESADSNTMSGIPNNGYGSCAAPSTTLNSVVYCQTNQKTCLSLGWSKYSGQGFEKYEVYRRTSGGAWGLVQTITDQNTTSHDDNGLTCGTTYEYKVRLVVAGEGADSNTMYGNPNNGMGGCW
ncbi:MAG TPA: fibronectin type III domain-containing protein [Candidatus Thermoplasmatota archaeon]|nr:fibronectin type III domain-containing protein [Candidatus Thermoplasmatota archaeon]